MRRVLLTLVCVLGLTPSLWGQAEQTLRLPFHPMDINVHYPLGVGLQHWYLPISPLVGNKTWYSLVGANHGTLTGMGKSATTGWGATLRPGGEAQLNFDGTDDYVSTSINAGVTPSTPFTLCAWVFATGPGGNGTGVIIQTAPENQPYDGVWFSWQAGRPRFLLVTDESNQTGIRLVATLNQSVWYHVCGTSAGTGLATGMALYVNGLLATTATENTLGTLTTFTDRPWRIGTDTHSAPINWFQGAMGEVMVFRRALAAREIATLYQQSQLGYPTFLNTPSLSALVVQLGTLPTGKQGPFFPFFKR